MSYKIFMWKTPTNCEDKKPRGLRPINQNSLFEIKSHRFTWPFYPNDLLFSTFNFIHVRDTATTCCSLLDPWVPLKRLRSLIDNSNNQILE